MPENKKSEETAFLPFHETVIKAIEQNFSTATEAIAWLLKHTLIPKGHEKIITAWQRRSGVCLAGDELNDFGVIKSLLLQKEVAEKRGKREDIINFLKVTLKSFTGDSTNAMTEKTVIPSAYFLTICEELMVAGLWEASIAEMEKAPITIGKLADLCLFGK